jgi:cytochrome c556
MRLRLLTMVGGSAVGLLCSVAAQGADSRRDKTRSIMDEIYVVLQDLLPMSIDQKAFHDEKNAKNVQEQAARLAKNAHLLEQHVRANEPALEFIAKSMGTDAREISRRLQEGRLEEARFVLHNITENCISCHIKFSAKQDFPGSTEFFKKVNIGKLSLVDQARLQIATRQFDQALDTLEKLFSSSEIAPADLVFMDTFTDYLKVAVRVKGDVSRAKKTLEKFVQRKDLPDFVTYNVRDWIAGLDYIADKKLVQKSDLETARQLVGRARGLMEYPRDRDGMVHMIVASGTLNEFVIGGKRAPAELSEAYYLLGLIESVIGRSFWISQSEYYLEAAIRTAPKTEFARKSYALLEENLILDYSGSSGTNLPDEVKSRLRELRGLISAS